MFQKLFKISYNGKKFLVLRADNSRLTFLEVTEEGGVNYPKLEDFQALNNIYNNHDFTIMPSERLGYPEKIRWKESLLALIVSGSIIFGTVKLMPTPNFDNLTVHLEVEDSTPITPRAELANYFEGKVTIEDVIEAIHNNRNLNDEYKKYAFKVLETYLDLDPNMDLRIFYENIKRLKIKIINRGDPTAFRERRNESEWFDMKTTTLYIWGDSINEPSATIHGLFHAGQNLWMEIDGKTVRVQDITGYALEEAMTEELTSIIEPETSAYSTERKVLRLLLSKTNDFNYSVYNSKGIPALIEELKKVCPEADIDYIISYLDQRLISRLEEIEVLEDSNVSEFTPALFSVVKTNIDLENPYRSFMEFLDICDDLSPMNIVNYFREYVESLKVQGYDAHDAYSILLKYFYKNKNVSTSHYAFEKRKYIPTPEEGIEVMDALFQDMLKNMSLDNLYLDYNLFESVFRDANLKRWSYLDEQLVRYDEEAINNGFLTREQVSLGREIVDILKYNGKKYWTFNEDNFGQGATVRDNAIGIFPCGRDYTTTVLNEKGESEELTIPGTPFQMKRFLTLSSKNELLRYMATHNIKTAQELANPEVLDNICEENHYLDNRQFNQLSNGETLFDELTPDMFVVVGLDENQQLGFQLYRGDELLYSTCSRFVGYTAKVPYEVYATMNDYKHPFKTDYSIEERFTSEYLDNSYWFIRDYYLPNMKRTELTEGYENDGYPKYEYTFNKPTSLILDGQKYSLRDVYFFIAFDKQPSDIYEYLYLHIPGEDDIYIGNWKEMDLMYNMSGWESLEEVLEMMGIEIPENGEFPISKGELKVLLKQFINEMNKVNEAKKIDH